MSDVRTLQPTVKRRQQARQEGRVAASSQVVGAVVWLVIALVLYLAGNTLFSAAHTIFELTWSESWNFGEQHGLGEHLRECVMLAGAFTLPVLGLVLFLAIVCRLAQVGFLWVPGRVVPDMNRLNPRGKSVGLLSAEKLVLLIRGAALIVCALGLVGWGIWYERETLWQLLASANFEYEVGRLMGAWGLRLGLCMALFAVLDYAYQRYRFEVNLRMSPEEVRAEVEAVEGNAHVTAGQKKMRQDIRFSRGTTTE